MEYHKKRQHAAIASLALPFSAAYAVLVRAKRLIACK